MSQPISAAERGHGDVLFDLSDEEMVNFWIGAPHQSLLPTDLLTKAMQARSQSPHYWTSLQYGPAKGQPWVLEELAKFLRVEYRDESVTSSRLMMTSGASQSLFNLIAWLTDSETTIFIEDPTYFVFPEILKDHGIGLDRIVILPTDEDGVDVEFLASYLKAQEPVRKSAVKEGCRRFPYFYYTVPAFANPTGVSLSQKRAEKLAQLSSDYELVVVCDDVYPLLYYKPLTRPLPRLFSLCDAKTGLIISNCTFSKILAPGLRVGWIEASDLLIDQFSKRGLLASGGGVAQASSALVAELLKSGSMSEHVDKLRRVFGARVDAVNDYLQANLNPHKVKVTKPQGGYFFWLRLPETVDTALLLRATQHAVAKQSGKPAKAATHLDNHTLSNVADDFSLYKGKPITVVEKIAFAPGSHFSLLKNYKNYMRISFTFYEERVLMDGVEKLCKLLNSVI